MYFNDCRQNGSPRTSPAQSVLTLPEPSTVSELGLGGVSEIASLQNGKKSLEYKDMSDDEE